jgi:hypothetical protein
MVGLDPTISSTAALDVEGERERDLRILPMTCRAFGPALLYEMLGSSPSMTEYVGAAKAAGARPFFVGGLQPLRGHRHDLGFVDIAEARAHQAFVGVKCRFPQPSGDPKFARQRHAV